MEKYLPNFTEEVLKRISAATYVATFADHVSFTETLQRHKEDSSSLLQHMADCYKALFTDKSSCASASIAITHPVNGFKSIRALHKNNNAVAMLTGNMLLRHFGKGLYHGGIGSCTLLSLMYSWWQLSATSSIHKYRNTKAPDQSHYSNILNTQRARRGQ